MAAKSVARGWVSENIRMDGKTVLITGANTGIGYETAKDLAARGAKILMACRDAERCSKALETIQKDVPEAQLTAVKLDLASLESVRECVKYVLKNEEKLDVLINNAGVMSCPQWETKDGFEMQLGVNHIGHFLLTNLLLDLLKKSAPSRIVVVSSSGHRRGQMNWDDPMHNADYSPFPVYCQSKLANVLFVKELSKRLEGTGVTCNSLHPGLVYTELGRHFFNTDTVGDAIKYALLWPFIKLLFKTPQKGAQTSIYCAVTPELEKVTGKYFADCEVEEESAAAKNDEDAKRLWDLSVGWVGLGMDQSA